MKISIIVPVYNGAKYLPNLIDSIVNQMNKDIELILVDDGSTDNSYDLCRQYEKNFQRVRAIKKENGGICSARNTGLKNATGEWISFIDQDDLIENDMYSIFIDAIDKDIDMIVAGKVMYVVDENEKVTSKKKYVYPAITIEKNTLLPYQTNFFKKNELSHLWNCLYRTSILKNNNILFNTVFKYGFEDILFNIEFSSKCRRIKFVDRNVYNYYRRKSSSTSYKINNNYLNELDEYLNVSSTCMNKCVYPSPDKEYMIYQFLLKHCVNLFFMYGEGKPIKESRQDLRKISLCLRKFNDKKIKKIKQISFTEYIYVSTINFLLNHNSSRLLNMVLKVKNQCKLG